MIGIKEKSLALALEHCFLTELPKKEDREHIWIRAIAEVEKRDGSHSYVYVEKDTDTLENIIKVDFGRSAQTKSVLCYYPFCYLDEAYLPEFKTKGKDERVAYLNTVTNTDNKGLTVKELDKEILKIAISRQLKIEKKADYAKRKNS